MPLLGQLPGAQPDHRASQLERKGDLGQRAELPAHRDDGRRRAHDDHVARLTHPGHNRHVHVGVGVRRAITRQHPNRQPARRLGSPAGGRHHAPQPATDERRTRLGQATPHRLGQRRLFRRAHAPAHHSHNRSASPIHNPTSEISKTTNLQICECSNPGGIR